MLDSFARVACFLLHASMAEYGAVPGGAVIEHGLYSVRAAPDFLDDRCTHPRIGSPTRAPHADCPVMSRTQATTLILALFGLVHVATKLALPSCAAVLFGALAFTVPSAAAAPVGT